LSDCKKGALLDLIRRALYTPLEVQHHAHASLLADIVRAIAARPCPVHIFRVRAHVGIRGNEEADALAMGAAARGAAPPAESAAATCGGAPNAADVVADVALDETGPLAPQPALPTRKTAMHAIMQQAMATARRTATGRRLAAIARSDDPPVLQACVMALSAHAVPRDARDVARSVLLPCRINPPPASVLAWPTTGLLCPLRKPQGI